MKKYLLLLPLVLISFLGLAQQHIYKHHYNIIKPDLESSLDCEKALNNTQVDQLRFMNERRQIPVEGTHLIIELFSAQELLITYGKSISPLTIKNPLDAPNVSFKLAKNKYTLQILPNLPLNNYAKIDGKSSEQITTFGSILHDGESLTEPYSNNLTYIKTIYSDNGERPYLNFTSFSTEPNFDIMYIYDGADASSKLIGAYSGGNNPKIVQASGLYLTVVFTSDGSNNSSGWAAMVERGTPPPPSPMSAPSCAQADPFCTGTTYTFPATVGGTAGQSGPNYGCLGSEPNPAWYYLQIANSGNLVLHIAGSGGYDVDFICWGPFTSPTGACTAGLTSGSIVDCSYSTSATETDHIPNAIAGQFYMVMITNYANIAQNIVFSQTGGTGSTNCSIVAPCSLTASNTGSYCVGQTISIAATSTATGTYHWTGPGSYSSNVQNPTRPSATAAMSGTYTVVLTTTTGTCTATTDVTVNATPTVTVNAATICSGSSAVFTASGATSYSWTPSTGLSATTGSSVTSTSSSSITYSVTGTTGACTNVKTAILTVNPTPTVTATSPTICSGSAATITAGGATTYSWSNGSTTNPLTISPTTTTSYTVTGTSVGCTGTKVVTVSVTPTPTVTVNNPTICPGGTAILTANGATTYLWSTGATTNTISVSPGSTQTYSVTGSNGACSSSALATVTIGAGVAVAVPSATICTGSSVVLTASGATTYTWSPATGLSSTTGTSVTANPATTQTYVITGASGVCTGTTSAVVTVTPKPTVIVPSGTICAGGSFTLTATGGSTSYSWSPATGLSATTGSVVIASPTASQNYNITGTSVSGCTATAVAAVSVVPLPTVTVNNPTICTGGTAVLNPSGATTYSWSTGATTTNISVTPASTQIYTVTGTTSACSSTATSTVTVVTTPTVTVASATICTGSTTTLTASGASTYVWSPATGLSATTGSSVTANPTTTQSYNIIGTAGTCTASATAIVTVNPLPILSIITPTICSGNTTTLTASGASTYTWNTGPNTNTIAVSPAGNTTYTVNGTDLNGCTNFAVGTVSVSASVTVTVNDPIICTGFTTTLTATGATTYSWNTGATVQTITISPTVTTSYTVTGSQNGCSGTEYGTVTVVTNPTVTVSSATICAGGSATLTANGASQYAWTPSTGLSSTTNSMVIANPPSTTTYTVIGTAGTCTASGTGVVTVNPLPIITATSGTICVGQQTATLTASGGVSYTWTPGASLNPPTGIGNPVVANPASTQNYTISGTDANGCINTGTAHVTVNPLPTITATSGTICVGQQTVTITASGGTSYVWSPATGLSGTTGTSVAANPGATQNYTVTGTDANGCVNTGTTSVLVNSLPTVTATSTSVCPTFAGTITGGGASTYTWSTAFVGANLTQTPAATTSYTVTGTDVNTCTNTATGTISVFPTLTVTVNSATICIGQQMAVLTPSGAVNYSWNPQTSLSPITGSPVNATPNTTTVYTVTGTVGTCSATATSTVTVNSLPIITATSAAICLGEQTATLTANGATTYTWTPVTGLGGTNGPSVTGNPTATQTYVVKGTDANGCIDSTSAIITVFQLPIVSATSTSVCPGVAGSITASGASNYTWSSTPAVTGTILTETPAAITSYIVTGTDANNCFNTATGTINVYNTFTISVNDATICAAGQQTATLTATGASTYVWSPVAGISSNVGTSVTTIPSAVSTLYTIIGTSAVGSCTASTTANLTVNALPQPVATANTPCANQDSLKLNCTPANLLNYSWTGPASYMATGSNPEIPFNILTIASAGIYTVTVTDNNLPACTNTTVVNVTVNPLPNVIVTTVPVCIGDSINLVTSGGVTYSWSHPSEPSFSSSQNPLVRPNSTFAMAGNYAVIAIDANHCRGAGFATVIVDSLPVVIASANAICFSQQTATLTAGGALTYTWTGSYVVNSIANPAHANPTTTSIYTVTGTDENKCVNSATTTVTVYALPTVTTPSVMPDCIPLCHPFVVTSPAATSISAYNWSFGNGSPSSTQASPTQCYTVAGTSTVILMVTDINGCKNTDTTTVTAFSVPTAAFTYGEQPVSVLAPEVHFDNQSTPGLNYNWTFGDVYNNTDSVTNPTHTYPTVGFYTVTLTASSSNGCSATTQEVIQIFDDYVLYVPNAFTPNEDGKNEIFKPVGEGITDYKLYIFDRWGSLIFFSDDINKGWDGTYQAKGDQVVQQDVFVWKIQLKNVLNESKALNGTVTLIK